MSDSPYHDQSLAFTLGEDYAYYRLPLPDKANESMRQGYKEGTTRFAHKKHKVDRFIKKWLQIRVGAWNRNRVFNPDVTPEYLQQIDNKVCPVSGVVLTHSTFADTDWSVDRLNNNAAYARGNLVVLSTRVNAAKGGLTWQQIATLGNANIAIRGLSALEWCRLWRLVSSTVQASRLLAVRECIEQPHVPRDLLEVWSLRKQHELVGATNASASARKAFWNSAFAAMPPDHVHLAEALQASVLQFVHNTPASERSATRLASSDTFWDAFSEWWKYAVQSPEFKEWVRQATRLATKRGTPSISSEDLAIKHALGTRGYN